MVLPRCIYTRTLHTLCLTLTNSLTNKYVSYVTNSMSPDFFFKCESNVTIFLAYNTHTIDRMNGQS
jgi:hypothetical protein